MNTLNIYKAQGIGGEEIRSRVIVIETELPQFESIEKSVQIFEKEADALVEGLCASLPGGTLDRVIAKLLMKKATAFNVPLFEKKAWECRKNADSSTQHIQRHAEDVKTINHFKGGTKEMTQQAAAEEKKEATKVVPMTPLALSKRDFVDVVASKVKGFLDNGELFLPKDYSPDNALKAAWLQLQSTVDKDGKLALNVCTRDSIANSLLDMIVQGLNPMKRQLYFIVYGNKLTCQRSYFGSMAVAQMVNPAIAEFAYAVVYDGDKFKYGIQNGKKTVSLHEQDIDNVDKTKIKGAYCIALDKEGNPLRTEIMTWEEIKQAWRQSKMNPIDDKGNVKIGSTHEKFSADMALKSVINKTCKLIINASSDNSLLLERINRAEDLADAAAVEEEIAENANTGEALEIPAGETAGAEAPGPEPSTEQLMIKCPEGGTMVTKDYCDKECASRQGCPEFGDPSLLGDTEKKEEPKKGPGKKGRGSEMKVFLNLIIETDAYDDPDKIMDAAVAALEEEGFKVPWFKVKEAD